MMTGKSWHQTYNTVPHDTSINSNDIFVAQAERKGRRRSSAVVCSCRTYPSVSAAQECVFRAQGYVNLACVTLPSSSLYWHVWQHADLA